MKTKSSGDVTFINQSSTFLCQQPLDRNLLYRNAHLCRGAAITRHKHIARLAATSKQRCGWRRISFSSLYTQSTATWKSARSANRTHATEELWTYYRLNIGSKVSRFRISAYS